MNPNRSQLFFADTVVLVEGETEKLMFQKWAEYFFPDAVAKRITPTYVDCEGKCNIQLYQEMLTGYEMPYVVIIDDDAGSEDASMSSINYHIHRNAEAGKGYVIMLEGDFEREFAITGHDLDRGGNKKFKPYQAFQKYFNMDQTPKTEELEKLRRHPKLQQIFFSIYHAKI